MLTPPQQTSVQVEQRDGNISRGTLEGWLMGAETEGTLRHGDYGEVELKKQKPPDGELKG